MQIFTDPVAIDELTSRSIDTIYPSREALVEALSSGTRLSFYVGIDPTAHYVHLGHSTNYLILERLHNMGHRIIVLVGDFTAMIGDPSDKTSARVKLTREQVSENLKSFKQQIGKILDFDNTDNPIEFKFNSAWLSTLTFEDAVELASNFTVQQMIERDAFAKRMADNKPLYVHEFFYPLMQGYDSVAMDVDGEIGGTDQTFNMLAGRVLQRRINGHEKFVITTTLLENPMTGEKLMSKSLGTGIGLDEEAEPMFFKVMQLPDEGIVQCFVDCTRLPLNDIDTIKQQLADGANPRDIKLLLAETITAMYHSSDAAQAARVRWLSVVSDKKIKDQAVEANVSSPLQVIEFIVGQGITDSKSQARTLLTQGAVRLQGHTLDSESVSVQNSDLLQIGKKHTFRLRLK